MNRRVFMLKSASFVAGSLFGFKGLPKAFAFGMQEEMCYPKPGIALIIDDIGFSYHRARAFFKLHIPLTFSILPRLPKSYNLAREALTEGQEIMLHQPMQPSDPSIDPGPGALYVGDEKERIADVMEENFSGLPEVTGVNNHMGSKFTESQRDVEEVLEIVKKKSLFFIDSLTSGRSTAYNTAKRLNIETARRNIFLDNRLEEPAIRYQLLKLKNHALKHGCAIGIGHPFPETAMAVRRFKEDLEGSGVSLVHASQLICFT